MLVCVCVCVCVCFVGIIFINGWSNLGMGLETCVCVLTFSWPSICFEDHLVAQESDGEPQLQLPF